MVLYISFCVVIKLKLWVHGYFWWENNPDKFLIILVIKKYLIRPSHSYWFGKYSQLHLLVCNISHRQRDKCCLILYIDVWYRRVGVVGLDYYPYRKILIFVLFSMLLNWTTIAILKEKYNPIKQQNK